MLTFNDITINELDLFKNYLNIKKYPNSEYNFTTFFAWESIYKTKYAIINDMLVVKGFYKNMEYCYFPVGDDKNFIECFKILDSHFCGNNKPCMFSSLSDGMISLLKDNIFYDKFKIYERRDFFDYIYLREKLVNLSGKKLHGKKNHFNFFEKNYSYSMKDITSDNEAECEALLLRLIDDRSNDKQDETIATMRVLKYRDKLGLIGKCLYVDDKIIGVILGEDHHGTALIQIAKADIEFRGASVALFKLFLEQNFTNLEYVNFMEDMGLEGLRKAKLSYHPEKFVEKFFLSSVPFEQL